MPSSEHRKRRKPAEFRCPNCGRGLERGAKRCYACPWKRPRPIIYRVFLFILLVIITSLIVRYL